MLTEADRLSMLRSLGAEEFDTGRPTRMWGVLEGEYNNPELTGIEVEGEIRWIEVRHSDVEAHELVKRSKLLRVATGEELFVKRIEPSTSSGFAQVYLTK